MFKKQMLLITVFGIFQVCNGNGLLLGDRTTTAAGDSFSFQLNSNSCFDLTNEYFYVSTAEVLTGDARPYAIAGTTLGAKINQAGGFVPFAPEKVTFNGQALTANPLYGAQITQMGMAGTQPVAVKTGTANTLYWITSKLSATTQTMVSNITNLKDAAAADSNGVVIIDDNQSAVTITGAGNTLFVAVKPNLVNNFGADNSGIAVLTKTDSGLTQEKAAQGDDVTVKAVKFDKTIVELNMGGANINALRDNAVNLSYNSNLQRLYIATGVQTEAVNGGARLVTVGYVNDQGVNGKKLILNSIAPVAAFTAGNSHEIVGFYADNQIRSLVDVQTMNTSTGLTYLIVRGSSSVQNGLKTIYALPLVDESADPAKSSTFQKSLTHGTLAKKNTAPTDYYATASNGIAYFYKRGFQTPATVAGDLLLDTDAAAKIGSGNAPGNVSKMQVYKDAVFISTHLGTNPEKSGIFYSQPIFDVNGVIVNWTAWQRIYYPVNAVAGDVVEDFAFSPTKGQLFTLEGTFAAPDQVRRTEWSDGANDDLLGGTAANASVGFVNTISAQFPKEQGGVMGLFDFDKSNPFFDQDDDENVSLMVATGYKKIAIIKTGTDTAGSFASTTGDFTTAQRTFTAGAIDTNSVEGGAITNNSEIIAVSGGALNDLGAISSAVITGNVADAGGYLVVGGTGGVAVLRTVGYAGWANTGLTKNLATDLGTTRYFQKIGNFSNVKKLCNAVNTANAYVLYVLTDKALYRITGATLANQNPTVTTIATIAGLGLPSYASFSDFIASKKLGLLATSHGLYRTGNGNDISTSVSETAVGWTSVTLPTSYTSIVKLVPLSKSVFPYEFADGAPGQVYYLAAKVGSHASALGCLAISDAATAVGATTVQSVVNPATKTADNVTINHAPIAFLGNYRNCFVTHGGSFLVSSPQQLTTTAKLMRLPLLNGIGYGFNYLQEKEIALSGLENATTIGGLERNSATGSWIVYGDFGLQVLE